MSLRIVEKRCAGASWASPSRGSVLRSYVCGTGDRLWRGLASVAHGGVMHPDPSRRTYLAIAALVALSASISRMALAQPVPVPVPTLSLPGVPPDDAERMHAAAARLYEGRSISTIERWRSPDTQDAGEVQLIRNFSAKGMPCRTIRYTIRHADDPKRLHQYVVNWCHVSGDTWKIVELPRR